MSEPNADCRCARVRHVHGTHECYRSCGCRRQECRDAHTAAVRVSRRQRAYGRSGSHLVDASPVREHLQLLARQGWGSRAISRETGLSHAAVSNIIYSTTPERQKVRADTARKLLSFTPDGMRRRRQGTGTETVDATGAKRRIKALVTLGFSLTALAEYAGYGRSYCKKILAAERIEAHTATVVSDLYERLWNKKPLPETRAQKQSVTKAKKLAKERGWLPPMAWDDDLIDDPTYRRAA